MTTLTETTVVDSARRYTVAVRALCEFAAKQGDLDLRFTPSPSAQEGVAGHSTVAASRSGSYRREVSVRGSHGPLDVRGRADGFDRERLLLEEVKTFKGDLTRMPDNHRALHWAQAKVYGALLCRQFDLASLTVSLVYFDVGQQLEREPLTRHFLRSELQSHFEMLCERFTAWAGGELLHREARDNALRQLRFPHESFRTGQRELARTVFQAARLGRCLLAQAPTGIGKTLATLFPILKACPEQALDKVFFLTAKGPGGAAALDAMNVIRRSETLLPLRQIELVAREKCCEHPDKFCHGDSCPLAKGFYDRLPAARSAAAAVDVLTRDRLREVALSHTVCPYYLGQEMVRWSDVVVGDYNHFFDSTAMLHGLTQANGWRVVVLVDEAHNLIERARAMYSASLDSSQLRRARLGAPPELKRPLEQLQRHWSRLLRTSDAPYQIVPVPPKAFVKGLQNVTSAVAEHFEANSGEIDPELQRFHFDVLKFSRLLETFGEHSIFDVGRMVGDPARPVASALCVRNVVPAAFLKPRFACAHSTVLFSATLTPWHFHADTLGLPEDLAWLDVAAPFTADQLTVRIVRNVSTRYQDRTRSLEPIARIIAQQYRDMPGNYIAFFSSFDYLEQALKELTTRHPEVAVWHQKRRTAEPERRAFLDRFVEDGRGVAFAVLGGVFSEGVDLPGSRLVGAFIATLGLPQFNKVNEAFRHRLDRAFGKGKDYTYLYPGLRKVVQAAGRVIRTVDDRGTVYLIDDRFAREEVKRLLPSWWQPELIDCRSDECGLPDSKRARRSLDVLPDSGC